MRRTALPAGVLAAALAAASVLSCQLFVDVNGLSNGKCPAGQKLCNGQCQSTSDPKYGCNSTTCVPCEFVNAYAVCDQTTGACVSTTCFASYKTCSDSPDAACTIDLDHSADNCGTCGYVCAPVAHGSRGCTNKLCSVGGCDAGYEDCNQVYLDGCETNLLTDPAHCGACGHACDAGSCHQGVCQPLDGGAD